MPMASVSHLYMIDEKQALEGQVSGRVRALREMFNKGGASSDAAPAPAPERKVVNKFVANRRLGSQGSFGR